MRQLPDDGWIEVAQRGSYRQFKHPTKPGKVTVAGKLEHDVRIGTYKSILRQAGLERN